VRRSDARLGPQLSFPTPRHGNPVRNPVTEPGEPGDGQFRSLPPAKLGQPPSPGRLGGHHAATLGPVRTRASPVAPTAATASISRAIRPTAALVHLCLRRGCKRRYVVGQRQPSETTASLRLPAQAHIREVEALRPRRDHEEVCPPDLDKCERSPSRSSRRHPAVDSWASAPIPQEP
jgi:hypothetical protein